MSMFYDSKGELKQPCKQAGGFNLWFTSSEIGVNGTSYPIAGVTASVETAGSLSHKRTITRNLFLLGKSKKVDTREAYIVVEGPAFQDILTIKVKDAEPARQYCAKLNTAAKRAS